MSFKPGDPKPPSSGRKKGTPNKDRQVWVEFCTALVDRPDAQQKLQDYVLNERPDLLFKAAEFAYGKPTQFIRATVEGGYVLPKGDDVAESNDAPGD